MASDGSHDVALSPKADSRSEVELSAISDTVKDGAKDALQTTQEVWETAVSYTHLTLPTKLEV